MCANWVDGLGDYESGIAAMFARKRETTTEQLDTLKVQTVALKNDFRTINTSHANTHQELTLVSQKSNENLPKLSGLASDIEKHHQALTKFEEQKNALEMTEEKLNAIIDKTVAIALATGLSVAGVAAMPVAPMVGQGMLGAVSAAVYAVKAPMTGDAHFTFRQFFKQLGMGMSMNSLISVISIPLIQAIGKNVAAKICSQGFLNALGRIIEKKVNGDPVEMKNILISFFAGCGGALASAGIEKMSEDAVEEIFQIVSAGCASAANAGVSRMVINAIEYNSLMDGVWEVMLISGSLGVAIKYANIQHDKKLYQEYSSKKNALEQELESKNLKLKDAKKRLKEISQNSDKNAKEIEAIKVFIKALNDEIGKLNSQWNVLYGEMEILHARLYYSKIDGGLAKETIEKIVKNLLDRGYVEQNRAVGDTRTIVERVLNDERVVFRHNNHRASIEMHFDKIIYVNKHRGKHAYRQKINVGNADRGNKEVGKKLGKKWAEIDKVKNQVYTLLGEIEVLRQQRDKCLQNNEVGKNQDQINQLNREIGNLHNKLNLLVEPDETPLIVPPAILGRVKPTSFREERAVLRKTAEAELKKLKAIQLPTPLNIPSLLQAIPEAQSFVPNPIQPFVFVSPIPLAPVQQVEPIQVPAPLAPLPQQVGPVQVPAPLVPLPQQVEPVQVPAPLAPLPQQVELIQVPAPFVPLPQQVELIQVPAPLASLPQQVEPIQVPAPLASLPQQVELIQVPAPLVPLPLEPIQVPARSKLVKAVTHRNRLVEQIEHTSSGKRGRMKRASLSVQIRAVEERILGRHL